MNAPLRMRATPRPCPLCGSEAEPTPVAPTMKLDPTPRVHPAIQVSVCARCGLCHEHPLIDVLASEDYGDRHYYNARNQLAAHDARQRWLNLWRWLMLEPALAPVLAGSTPAALDVGASGAWSDWLTRRVPGIRSVLVEPSREAVDHARAAYSAVTAVRAPFEAFTPDGDGFDLVSFFYSFYVLADPRAALRKTRQLLRPGGRLVITISHVLMETEIWACGAPWLNLYQLIRGVPLVYYSPRTLRALLEDEGFAILDELVFEYPSWDEQAGRQERIFVACAREAPARRLTADSDEATHAERFVRDYAAGASRRSVDAFLARRPVTGVTVVAPEDPAYRDWLVSLFGGRVPVGFAAPAAAASTPDRSGHHLLLAGAHGLSAPKLACGFTATEVTDAAVPSPTIESATVPGPNGPVIAHAFAPLQSREVSLFPFQRPRPHNDLGLSFDDLLHALRLPGPEAGAWEVRRPPPRAWSSR